MDTLLASQLIGAPESPHPLMVEYLQRHDVCGQIIERGFAEVPWGDLRPLFNQAQLGLERLILKETETRRQHFRVPDQLWQRDEIGEEYEIGLLVKRRGDKKKQLSILEASEKRLRFDGNKYRFHYHSSLLEHLYQKDRSIISTYADLLGPCALFNAAGYHIALAMSALFDELNRKEATGKQYPGSLLAQTLQSMVVTRLLQYMVSPALGVDAAVHRDRGCFTMHWLSSNPGLVLFDHEGKARSAHEHDPHMMLIFPSVKFWVITRERFGLGLFHGAKDTRRDSGALAEEAMRYVAVTFSHAALGTDDLSWLTQHIDDPRLESSRFVM